MSSVSIELLGRVTVWTEGGWVADLTRQQRHLTAALALAEGRPVSCHQLEGRLWDHDMPGGGLRRVASELRTQLRPAFPDRDPVPGANDAYRLLISADQVDAHRFRREVARGRKAGGRQGAELIRQALTEWGRDASSSEPLRGLPGTWAEGVRQRLRAEYRDAWTDCLRFDLAEGRYDQALEACDVLSDAPDALLDEPFVELWMLANHHAGHSERALETYRRAMNSARSIGRPSDDLHRTAELIRSGHSKLVPARITAPTDERSPMSEEKFTFNISGQAKVGTVAGNVHGPITISMAGEPEEKNEDDNEPEVDG
jgi:DNA-binding SARP family transcriptional activator